MSRHVGWCNNTLLIRHYTEKFYLEVCESNILDANLLFTILLDDSFKNIKFVYK